MKIFYSAPGKIILSGEHAVVYGKPALVSAVDLRLTFRLSDTRKKYVEMDETINVIKDSVVRYLIRNKIQFQERSFEYKIESSIPIGRGMGSSAALSVAASAAILRYFTQKEFDNSVVNSIAYQGEKYFHANPSGVDVSASCYGGLIYFRKEFEFLKNISALNFKIPKTFQDNLVLIDTGKPEESTKEMVQQVGKRYNESPKNMANILNEIEKITKRMVVSITTENTAMFQESIEDNEKALEQLGVVSESTIKLLQELKPFGVGKVTGAGGKTQGSGLLLFYITNHEMFSAVKKKYSTIKINPTTVGLQSEN